MHEGPVDIEPAMCVCGYHTRDKDLIAINLRQYLYKEETD